MAEKTGTEQVQDLLIDPKAIDSAALARIVAEVTQEEEGTTATSRAYDRVHHRHNR